MSFMTKNYESPVGRMILVAHEDGLCGVVFEKLWPRFERKFPSARKGASALLDETSRQLDAYFAGTRQKFDLPLSFIGTEFQKKVWQSLFAIPFASTLTYKQQAHGLGMPSAVRAIARANGQNPLCLIAPCHRVLGSGGSLTGYAGGLDAKRDLLRMEARWNGGSCEAEAGLPRAASKEPLSA